MERESSANEAGQSVQRLTTPTPLARRLARLKIVEDDAGLEWWGEETPSGLPGCLRPFYIREALGPNYVRTGNWLVCCTVRDRASPTGHAEGVVFDACAGEFEAFRRMVDAVEAWQPIRPVERVYFIGTSLAPGKLVKVGFSRDPEGRLRALQTAHGEPLQIFTTTPGGKSLEEKYHRRWRARRRSGEWFTIGDCIIDEINRLRAA